MEFKVSTLTLKYAKVELNETTDSLHIHHQNELNVGYVGKMLQDPLQNTLST